VNKLLEELRRGNPRVKDVLNDNVHGQDLYKRGAEIDEPSDLTLVVRYLNKLLQGVCDDVLDPDLKERIDLQMQRFLLNLLL
jgi:hypothetical protein